MRTNRAGQRSLARWSLTARPAHRLRVRPRGRTCCQASRSSGINRRQVHRKGHVHTCDGGGGEVPPSLVCHSETHKSQRRHSVPARRLRTRGANGVALIQRQERTDVPAQPAGRTGRAGRQPPSLPLPGVVSGPSVGRRTPTHTRRALDLPETTYPPRKHRRRHARN